MKRIACSKFFLLATVSLVAQMPGAYAQQTASGTEEIIVTARKRDESIMKTPVVVSAVTSKQIQDLKIAQMQDLASVTPGLKIGPAFAGVGATVFLRGLGNGDSAQLIDQSVALNIDGVTMGHGAFYTLGMFDVGQVEVLKGPQALFFGKSTSAGIIAIRSADPTSTWQAKASVGYEFSADEMLLDAYVSGPITDKLGIRVAGYHNTQKGWFYNPNPNAKVKRIGSEQDGARLTLKYDDPDAGFRGNLKIAALHVDSDASGGEYQQARCNGPTAQKNGAAIGYFNDCRFDNRGSGAPDPLPYRPDLTYNAGDPTNFLTGVPNDVVGKKGHSYGFTNGAQFALNLEYDVREGLTLTSVTGANFLSSLQATALPLTANSSAAQVFEYGGDVTQQEYSEELRLASNWKDSWINFMVGGLYSGAKFSDAVPQIIPAFTLYTNDTAQMKTRTLGGFGQILLTPIEKWELSAGVRYTDVHRYMSSLFFVSNIANPAQGEQIGNIPESIRSIREHKATPEVTLTYRPTDEITTFVSYKQGYKAPGFNFSTGATGYAAGVLKPFAGERANGVEGGVKAQLFDRSLNVSLAAYRYNYIGQQVSFVNNTSLVVETSNGANARVQGVELGVTYSPPTVPDLVLTGFINYNDAHYTSFPGAPCYGNQTVAQGCVGGVQNLAGQQLHRAPKWEGRVAMDYRKDLNDTYAVAGSLNINFASSYNAIPEKNPNGVQSAYATVDASVRFGQLDGPWELAVIGRNLTNEYILSGGLDGGVVPGGQTADALLYVYRPRQVMLQLTVRPEL